MTGLDRRLNFTPEVDLLKAFSPKTAALTEYFMTRSQWLAERFAKSALARSGMEEEDFYRRLTTDDRLAILFAMAIDAAQRSYVKEKTEMLAKAVSSGVIAEDEAQIDEAQVLVSTLRDLEVPHFRALMILQQWQSEGLIEVIDAQPEIDLRESAIRDRSIAGRLAEKLRVQRPIAHALLGTLTSQGLVMLDPPGFGGFHVTEWGIRVLAHLKEAATENPA
jgi:hypothetical protein